MFMGLSYGIGSGRILGFWLVGWVPEIGFFDFGFFGWFWLWIYAPFFSPSLPSALYIGAGG
jgi:hypothetical protein